MTERRGEKEKKMQNPDLPTAFAEGASEPPRGWRVRRSAVLHPLYTASPFPRPVEQK